VKTWAEVLEECKSRMKFVQEHLQANVNKESSLKYLKRTYEKYLTGISVSDQDDIGNEDTIVEEAQGERLEVETDLEYVIAVQNKK
jgi:hypothetical protein